MPPVEITPVHDASEALLRALTGLLRDVVDDGAAVGFLPPLSEAESRRYWHEVLAEAGDGGESASRVLLVARDEAGEVVGSVQLGLVRRTNSPHRAEVAKLLVHTACRRRGVGRALMVAVEEEARRRNRTTLVLDTREGEPSERLYQSLGYARAGRIPDYALSADRTFHATVLYYKLLGQR